MISIYALLLEKGFLRFFFRRLKLDTCHKYNAFPFVSPCGKEMNYVRCDDVPVVITKVLTVDDKTLLSYNNGEDRLVLPFQPESLCMPPGTGRIYHAGLNKTGGVALVKSALAIEWSQYFRYDDGASAETDSPTHFLWQATTYRLNNDLFDRIRRVSALESSQW